MTHPVPEFLCHLFSIVTDPALSHFISWSVPTSNEQDNCGGGRENVGKVVVHDPQGLQDFVLGKYYRHSRYSSFQRQLNYFGFKKKLHGGKKGKLCPCSYVHEGLGAEPSSLFSLKRRLRGGGKKGAAAAARTLVNNTQTNTMGGNDDDSKANSSVTTSSSPQDEIHNQMLQMSSNAAVSVSSNSSSLNQSHGGDAGSFTKMGEIISAPPSNKPVIVKDSNHANFLRAIPYPPPQMLINDTNSSSTATVNAPVTVTAPLPLIPNSSWGNNNNTMMAMPFQQNFQQQLLNNHSDANDSSNGTIQVPPSPAKVNNKSAGSDPSSKDFNAEITIARANEVARKAQMALERAYRKRKQETADEEVVVAPPPTANNIQEYPQQQQQLGQPAQQQQVQQQQQMILPPGYEKLMQQPIYTMQNQQQLPPPSMDLLTGNDTQAVNNVVSSSTPFDASAGQTIDFASLGKQIWSQLNPQMLQGLNAQLGAFPTAPSPAAPAAPFPSSDVSVPPKVAPFLTQVPPSNQPKQSNGTSSPIMFDDLFSKLLSTTLPPPEELFDDESSAGQLSDFDAELQALG